MNKDITISAWFHTNSLPLNIRKTTSILFSDKNLGNHGQVVEFDGVKIAKTKSTKFLV